MCGSLIVYQAEIDGVHYELGTSGFLYRSNKLMYDQATKSLWSTLQGKPVVGPLVGQGLELQRGHVVTTTWGAWKSRHPNTSVLSRNTGHDRDYSEGAAYKEYFSNKDLMFGVPKLDSRLPKKSEVLALRHDQEQLAIATPYLRVHKVYHDQIGDQNLVVLTNKAGGNRVYLSDDVKFDSWDMKSVAVDSLGNDWKVTEEGLVRNDRRLVRMPAHRAFWFGWHAQFPNTRMVK